ncbi:MAG: hypothetical protein IJ455_00040 [Agathobacter sp.]|nr:hypothetical protein [Agathobacter sp.]
MEHQYIRITLTDNSEEYVVENDVYSEIIGYESGTDDELMELQATVEAVDEADAIGYENMVTEVQPFALINQQAYYIKRGGLRV